MVESKSGNKLLAIHIEAHDERLNAIRGTEVVRERVAVALQSR